MGPAASFGSKSSFGMRKFTAKKKQDEGKPETIPPPEAAPSAKPVAPTAASSAKPAALPAAPTAAPTAAPADESKIIVKQEYFDG